MQALTSKSVCLITLMFSEPAIMKELIDSDENNLWSKVTVDSDTCEIVLGKTRCGWWNRLIGAEKRISLETFTVKVIGLLSSRANSSKSSVLIRQGLAEDVIDTLTREGKSNDVIDRLFLVGYMGVKTSWSCTSIAADGFAGGRNPVDVNLKINSKIEKFELPGSGDPIIEVSIGPTGARIIQ